MEKTLRLFVALPLPAPLKMKISGELLAAPYMKRTGLRPTPAANLHLTLHFIGDARAQSLHPLKQSLMTALSGISKFRLELRGSGVFPSMASPRVLWLGFTNKSREPLISLASCVKKACAEVGLTGDAKPFKPHLTIARIDNRFDTANTPAILANLTQFQADPFDAREVIVYSSDLSGHAPIYRAEAIVSLDENHDKI